MRGEKVKWRAHFNQLIARPIPKSEYPEIARRMLDDGLCAMLTRAGVVWYAGRYPIPKKTVRDIWGLSESQMKRFERWIYEEEPFMSLMEADDDAGV